MTAESHSNLRNAERFPLHLAVTLKTASEEHRGETIEYLGRRDFLSVKCQGRVVRCNEESSGRTAAVVIDEYKFERL